MCGNYRVVEFEIGNLENWNGNRRDILERLDQSLDDVINWKIDRILVSDLRGKHDKMDKIVDV